MRAPKIAHPGRRARLLAIAGAAPEKRAPPPVGSRAARPAAEPHAKKIPPSPPGRARAGMAGAGIRDRPTGGRSNDIMQALAALSITSAHRGAP